MQRVRRLIGRVLILLGAFARFSKKLLIFAGIVALLFAVGAGILLWMGFFAFPDFSLISDRRQMSILYDERDNVLHEYCTLCREIIPLGEMGHFPRFAVAVEDYNFYESNTPFRRRAIVRAFWRNLREMNIEEGASSITQQVARILFLEEELKHERETGSRSAKYWRKAREAWIATQLQRHLNGKKDVLLALYLNNVWCGKRHGVKACSRYIYGKEPIEMSEPETAPIVGLWRKPSVLSNPKELLKLRSRVFQQLADQGVITEEQKKEYDNFPLPEPRTPAEHNPAPHFSEFTRREVVKRHHLTDRGLRIFTTLDPEIQKTASESLKNAVEAMKKENPELSDLRGIAILTDRYSGAIKAFAQEPSFAENQYLIDQVKRSGGSAVKPFAYLAAIEKGLRLSCADEGMGPCEIDDSHGPQDGPSAVFISMGSGKPPKRIHNFPYEGRPRYREIIQPILALAESRNVATICMVKDVRGCARGWIVTKEDVLAAAVKLGVQLLTMEPEEAQKRRIQLISQERVAEYNLPPHTVDPGLTAAIGGGFDVTAVEMVRAFSGILGTYVEPYAIQEIQDARGSRLSIAEPRPTQVLDEKVSLALIRGLRATSEYVYKGKYIGTAAIAHRELDFPIIGKTGTATNGRGETTDNSFIGCSMEFCMYVHIGREKKLSLKSVEVMEEGKKRVIQQTGTKNALVPVFIPTMKKVYENRQAIPFPDVTDPNKPFRVRAEVSAPEKNEDKKDIKDEPLP